MNHIKIRQNEDNALRLQAAARWNLNRADNIDLVYWLALLVLPFLKMVWKENILVELIFIVWFCLTFFLDYIIGEYTRAGAEYKDFFDKYIYGWIDEIPRTVSISSKEKEAKHSKWFAIQKSNTGNDSPRGVKDWYELVRPNDTETQGFIKSMTENIHYDKRINCILLTIILSLVTLFIFFVYFNNMLFSEMLVTISITFSALTKKVITTIINIRRANEINKEVRVILEKSEDIIEFQYAQSLLYKKRLISGIGNRFIYSVYKNKITDYLNKIMDSP